MVYVEECGSTLNEYVFIDWIADSKNNSFIGVPTKDTYFFEKMNDLRINRKSIKESISALNITHVNRTHVEMIEVVSDGFMGDFRANLKKYNGDLNGN